MIGGQADGCRQRGQPEHRQQRHREGGVVHLQARQAEPISSDEPRPADHQHDGEQHRLPGDRGQRQQADRARRRDANHHGEDDHPQDVVDDRRSENDAAGSAGDDAEIAQHAGGDADAGGHHGRPKEHGLHLRLTKHERKQPIAEDERQDHASHRHAARPTTNAQDVRQPRFQSDEEQQDHDTQFADHVRDQRHRFGRGSHVAMEGVDEHLVGDADPTQRVRPDDGAGQKLANHRRLMQPLEQFGRDLRRKEDQEKVEQDASDLAHVPLRTERRIKDID